MEERRITHSRYIDGKCYVWDVERLWLLAAALPVKQVAIGSLPEFEEDCWFNGTSPSIRAVAEHCRRIMRADVDLPIILNADGTLMDGAHRIARAFLEGLEILPAVQFQVMPAPDDIS